MFPVGYTLPASRTHGYVNSHTAALTCLHVTVLCCVVCYKNCSKCFLVCFTLSVTIFKSTLLDKIFHYNRFLALLYVWWNGTNLLRLVNS